MARMIIYDDQRFSRVPWLSDAMDLRPKGAPETTVELAGEITHGLYVPCPHGPGTDAMLTVHAFRSGEITLAITNEIRIDTRTPPMRMDLLSNPIRHVLRDREDADGA